MSTFFQLDEHRLQALEKAIASSIPLEVLERGFDYYRREKVLSVQVMEGGSIYGAVKGTVIYAVTLDTDDFGFSTCTCPNTGYCKHMAAVFYGYYAYAGRSADEIHNRMLIGNSLVDVESSGPVTMKSSDMSVPGTETDPKQWIEEMDRKHGEVWRQCRHSLHPLQAVLLNIKAVSKLWDDRLRRLHWMHGILYVLEQAERAYSITDTYSRYYYEMAFARMTEPWMNQYFELTAELKPAEMTEPERAAVVHLIELFHEREMDREHQLHRWESLYFALWGQLVHDEAWTRAEEDWLKSNLESSLSTPDSAGMGGFFAPMALAFLAFADNRDADAIDLLGKTVFNRTALLACDCALQRLEERNYAKLEGWIGYLHSGLVTQRKSKAFGPFLSMCRLADMQQQDNPKWQQYLVSFLPHSYSALSEHWLDRKQYEQWADLQLLFGIEPDEMDVQLIREMSKLAPDALYPLYHQAIDGSIRSRNRQGYRQAVKLMKKLEKLYKAEMKADKWNRYVDGIVRKHGRLRALQEELWRGKIIT
ncbi:SWIM zinc finger domain-containing protein [Paenibacillus sp. OV219]|uniref:SWIM zinc finger family protein n=1 Tax=Paenibacillus sp. OV219 TaxID=1884377 RepID=UPI0008D1B8F0|nr:SWIM zinc finger family protein [Paenibacillus sp. OV219]SEN74052.1 SWIM zinc finger [Paenibacillus sp. OV219]